MTSFAILLFSVPTCEGHKTHISPTPPNQVAGAHFHSEDLLPSPDGVVLKGELVFTDYRPTLFVPCVRDHIEVRRPHLKLSFPVDDRREGSTNQIRTFGVALRAGKGVGRDTWLISSPITKDAGETSDGSD